jgi:hypothetical protein
MPWPDVLRELARHFAPYLLAVAICALAAWLTSGCGGAAFTGGAPAELDAGDLQDADAGDGDSMQSTAILDAGAGDVDADAPPAEASTFADAARVDAGDAGELVDAAAADPDVARPPVDAGDVDAEPARCCALNCAGSARVPCAIASCGALGASCSYAAAGCTGAVVACR